MLQFSRFAAAMIVSVLLSACATRPPVPDDALERPFVAERDLAGASVARGEFRAINGVRRPFTAELSGSWDGQTLVLVEDFAFADGERDRKTWRLERVGPGRYRGTREDVVGEAEGYQDGNVFRLEYNLRLPSENGRGRIVRFRDVMAWVEGGAVRNDATVGWHGLRVGSVSLTIERSAAPATMAEEAQALEMR